jgi:hypothetical protein
MATAPPAREGLCYSCRHFGVSYQPAMPYLCRIMGFKSKRLPIFEVQSADGRSCLSFAPKPAQTPVANRKISK